MSAKSDLHAAIKACELAHPSGPDDVDADGNKVASDARIACDKVAYDAYAAAKAADPNA